MRVFQLLESMKKPAPGVMGLKSWINEVLPTFKLPGKKNTELFWTREPSRVWTRGDGVRYKDAPFIEFTDSRYADAVWKKLTELPHTTFELRGPFGSDKRQAIKIGGNVYTQNHATISVYTKAGIDRSRVLHIADDGDGLLFDIIEAMLAKKQLLYINVRGKNGARGRIVSMDGRELTYIDDEGRSDTFMLPYQHMVDALYTIEQHAGNPTLVRS